MPRPDHGASPGTGNAATRWFGDGFAQLHPMLQALHREGGGLRGEVRITTGKGLAGLIGRRLARRLGIPMGRRANGFEVRIRHDEHTMSWERRFDNGAVMLSVFRPVGQFPDGCWLEDTGHVRLELGVDVIDGGWHWRLRSACVRGLVLPRWLFPRVDAFKQVDRDGRYRFGVFFSLLLVGPVLGYEGRLHAIPGATDRVDASGDHPPS